MKTTRSCENERKTISEERRLVLGRQKKSKKKNKKKTEWGREGQYLLV